MEDKIFTKYDIELLVKIFENHTGYKVCESQKQELKKFLWEWTFKNIEKVKEVE